MICSRFCIGSWRAAFIAATLVLCLAPFARAWTDIDWTGNSSSSVKYWNQGVGMALTSFWLSLLQGNKM